MIQENGEWLKQYVKVERLGLDKSIVGLSLVIERKAEICTDPCLKIFSQALYCFQGMWHRRGIMMTSCFTLLWDYFILLIHPFALFVLAL